jgi:hypothetical protein
MRGVTSVVDVVFHDDEVQNESGVKL